MWHRELAKFDTAKEKQTHLKRMLSDIGMTGQYSQAKAKKIKAERELQAELESIQPKERSSGAEDETDGEEGVVKTRSRVPATTGRPRVHMAFHPQCISLLIIQQRSRGLASIDFFTDNDESDSA